MTFEDLKRKDVRKEIPNVPGFYRVLIPKDFEVRIAEKTQAIEQFTKKNRIVVNQKEKRYLEDIWNELKAKGALEDRILYIGKALHLQERLYQYQNVMFNKGKNHSGGVYICQIIDCKDLEVEWCEHKSDNAKRFVMLPKEDQKSRHPIGREVNKELLFEEHRMIKEYCDSHGGMRPFANRID